MAGIKWLRRSKMPRHRARSEQLAWVTVQVSTSFKRALSERASLATKEAEDKIGQGAVLETLALKADPTLRQLTREAALQLDQSASPAK